MICSIYILGFARIARNTEVIIECYGEFARTLNVLAVEMIKPRVSLDDGVAGLAVACAQQWLIERPEDRHAISEMGHYDLPIVNKCIFERGVLARELEP